MENSVFTLETGFGSHSSEESLPSASSYIQTRSISWNNPKCIFFKTKQSIKQPFWLAKAWQFWGGRAGLAISELPRDGKAGTELSSLHLPRGPIHFVPVLLHLCKPNCQILPCMKSICNILETNSSSGFFRKQTNLLLPWDWTVIMTLSKLQTCLFLKGW